MQDDISGWSEWLHNFSKIEEISSPSELHGLLTGISLCDTMHRAEEWQHILDNFGNVPELSQEALALVNR